MLKKKNKKTNKHKTSHKKGIVLTRSQELQTKSFSHLYNP